MIQPGSKLAHYEIVSALGKGGMGEVWRARDTKLGREVAIKTLPPDFVQDADRVARFEREAKLLASLNHPNVAAIYGIEEHESSRFLVLELVEGDTLAGRLSRGAMPVEESLRLALQIAGALEAAHEKGVIHRDLKPANIKVTLDGKIKVLDFGLAKAVSSDDGVLDPANSPTLSIAATQQGLILGTAAYMSPEQARGQAVDKRTDIWAFGAVLLEMLTGKPAFSGDLISDILAAVIRAEPEWNGYPSGLHPDLRTVIERCLEKDSHFRWRDIGDVRIELSRIAGDPTGARTRPETDVSRRPWLWPALTATCTVLALVLGYWAPWRSEAERPLMFHEPPPVGTRFMAAPLPSPDGRFLAMRTRDDQGVVRIWVRPLDADRAQALEGTEGASMMFWSPDSEQIAFYAGGDVQRIPRQGGRALPVATVDVQFGGDGAWSPGGDLIVASYTGGIVRMPATGGTPHTIVNEEGVQYWSLALTPEQDRIAFVAFGGEQPGIYSAKLDGTDQTLLVGGDVNAVKFVAPDLAIYEQEGTMVAQRLDRSGRSLSGNPFPIPEQVEARLTSFSGDRFRMGYGTGGPVLTFLTGAEDLVGLAWFDREGTLTGAAGPDALYEEVHWSPDGTKLLSVQITNNDLDLWITNLEQDGALVRLSDDPGIDHLAAFSPDSLEVVWEAHGDGGLDIVRRPVDRSSPPELVRRWGRGGGVDDWSPDGQWILYRSDDQTTRQNLWAVPMDESIESVLVTESPFNEFHGRLSPAGGVLAYVSDVTGQEEVYVQRLDGMRAVGGAEPVSVSGGTNPEWRRDGRELFFLSQGSLMAVSVSAEAGRLEIGSPRELFPFSVTLDSYRPYAVSPDGQRFVGIVPTSEALVDPATVILNWAAGFED